MRVIPSALQARFEDHLRSKGIPDPLLWSYRKWLRYYLDYCEKYHFSSRDQNSLARFIGKLRDKKQTEQQQRQAAEAIKLYYEVLGQEHTARRTPRPQPVYRQEGAPDKDSKPLIISESPVTAVQPQKIVPAPSRNSAPLSGAYRAPTPVRVSGMPSIIAPDKENPASQSKQRDNGGGRP
jgi:site-specific recombinase XerD